MNSRTIVDRYNMPKNFRTLVLHYTAYTANTARKMCVTRIAVRHFLFYCACSRTIDRDTMMIYAVWRTFVLVERNETVAKMMSQCHDRTKLSNISILID